MHRIVVPASIANWTVASRDLSTLEFIQEAMNADEEYVHALKNLAQSL